MGSGRQTRSMLSEVALKEPEVILRKTCTRHRLRTRERDLRISRNHANPPGFERRCASYNGIIGDSQHPRRGAPSVKIENTEIPDVATCRTARSQKLTPTATPMRGSAAIAARRKAPPHGDIRDSQRFAERWVDTGQSQASP